MDWLALIQQLGLPTFAVLVLGYAFWKLLGRTLKNHDTDRETWKEAILSLSTSIKENTDMAGGNFSKLIDAVSQLTSCVGKHETSSSNEHKRILDSLGRIDKAN